MRYRLTVPAAPLVFSLTSGEKLRLRIRTAVRKPPLFGPGCFGTAEARERQGSTPQQALVARRQAEAGL